MWEKHYFGNWAFNADPDGYERMINERYGTPRGIEEFCEKAQLLNIESTKAMYEGWLDNIWEDASGILTWTSNASLPTLIWQTYDYYYDLTGAYWGAKKACEPIHIQWNPVNNAVKVINTTAESMKGLTATATVYNLDGTEVSKYRLSNTAINSPSNSATRVFSMAFPDENRDLALKRDIVASSSSVGKPMAIVDGDHTTRWASDSKNEEWIYVDLNQSDIIRGITLNWEDAYAKKFSVQISDDAKIWKDVLTNVAGRKGKQELLFSQDEKARYVRLALHERATSWGFSLWDLNVLGGNIVDLALDATHFIKLSLTDRNGKLISDNFYWRGNKRTDFKALNGLAKVDLKVKSETVHTSGKYKVEAQITNPVKSAAVAFAVRVQAVRKDTGEQIAPAFISDGYFSLLKGETKNVTFEFEDNLVAADNIAIKVTPFNGNR